MYTYDLNNRLLTERKNAGAEAELREYHYDANGNTLSVNVGTPAENGQGFAMTLTGGGAVAYTYDAFNRMTSVENGDGIHTYAYRPDGLRQSKTVGGVTTTHIWDGQNIAAEQENGAVTAVYVRGVNLLARQDNTGARQYYLYNAHGDVTQLTDEACGLVRAYDYDAFGNQRELAGNPGADGNPFRYCGEYWDNETGTYYLRARYYDPAVGRFLSEDTHWNPGNMIYGDDPLMLSKYTAAPDIAAITQSTNLYVYCGNNPIIYVDSDGHIFMFVTAAIGVVIGGAVGAISSYAKTGSVSWKSVAVGAAIGGAIGLTGGAAAAYITTGTAVASTSAVMTAGASWAASLAASGATTSAALGRAFEKWFYSFNNISQKAQQVVVNGIGRIDAFKNGVIYELKNYDWSKYSGGALNKVINNFVTQGQKYLQIDKINGQSVKDVVFYFSNKPPQQLINALKEIGAKVQWVSKP